MESRRYRIARCILLTTAIGGCQASPRRSVSNGGAGGAVNTSDSAGHTGAGGIGGAMGSAGTTGGSAGGGGASAGGGIGGDSVGGGGGAGRNDGGPGGDAGPTDGGSDAVSAVPRFKCPPGPFPAPSAGASQAICGAFNFKYNWNEGPTWVTSQGAFFFSNYVLQASSPGDIVKYTPGGQCETFIPDVGCNGLTASYDGNLVAVCQMSRAVVEFDIVTKEAKILAGMYMGQLLDSPNDVVSHHNGTIYFTNPTYELGGRPQGVGPAIFRLGPDGVLGLIAKVGNQPNGIAVSPDESRLYVELDGSGVKVYDLDAAGVPSAQSRDFAGGTDGMSVDCAGNLYLSDGSIISPGGNQIGTFPGGTMAAFGGTDGKTLIVVGSGTNVHVVQMNIPGPPH